MSKFKKDPLDNTNTLLTLSSIYNSLTRTEKKIADAIQQDPETVVYATLTDLAEKSGVGETSVLRLCRKIGFGGYQEFKLALAKDLVVPIKNVHSQIEETDDLSTMAAKITADNIQALENTLSLIGIGELQKAMELIGRARKIYFFGVGSSANTAADGKYRFMRLGFNVELVSDPHIMAMVATLMTPDDVVFGISTSGSTKDLVDAVRIAKQNGASIVCLTSHSRSPLTQQANVVLLTKSRETPLQGGAFSSKIAQIHVLDILSTATAINYRDKSYDAIERTAKAVLDKIY
ncbi:MurR/RpiR family transcriptional regulator [Paenibacillus beijingensis]|uniref:Transcriptional regulator n=1 Tax=Paenibacillus beijingensis TaxID=1126833 RepID=A0A0D5NII7_9BACL|nr:MurR/RpiR family transcriptional regulator [Paenibacillus beijingensis]AJY74728.1 transcriptional regulator [Paenibacillus beijingensis]